MAKTSVIAKDLETAELQRNVLVLKKGGHTYEEIAAQLGITLSKAYRTVQKALVALNEETMHSVLQHRCIEVAKLDYLEEVAMEHLVEEEELEDGGSIKRFNNATLANLLKIQERRAKLLGLDAPVKHEVNATNTHVIAAAVLPPQATSIEDWIAQNEANIIDAVAVQVEDDEQGGE